MGFRYRFGENRRDLGRFVKKLRFGGVGEKIKYDKIMFILPLI